MSVESGYPFRPVMDFFREPIVSLNIEDLILRSLEKELCQVRGGATPIILVEYAHVANHNKTVFRAGHCNVKHVRLVIKEHGIGQIRVRRIGRRKDNYWAICSLKFMNSTHRDPFEVRTFQSKGRANSGFLRPKRSYYGDYLVD